MWRRLLRWLARTEIAEANRRGLQFGYANGTASLAEVERAWKQACDIGYERGRLDGAREAFDAAEIEARLRFLDTGQNEGAVPLDVIKARKRYIH
jgi:hypothetical protein